ncbi:MAG TPA: BadF/BadG/BcrA/BcrD ATPase family protein [bacterium]|nr:BadF/BadG/BcrA/BcrD ATPase family protein [bacterium]
MEYFLGVDGGASSTICAVCSGDGVVLGIGHGGASNHILAPGGRERARRAVGAALETALRAADLGPVEFRAAEFGMTGINAGTDRARAFTEVVGEVLRAQTARVDNDASIALAGALACGPGVMVIAGTGSVALGLDPAGREARVGGWGYIFGDDGSAFAIGRAGVHAALHARDGSGPGTALVDRIPPAIGMDVDAIPMAFYEGRLDRAQVARLSRVVTVAAAAGDGVARRLVERAAASLADLVAAVIRRLTWPEGATPVAPVGGVFDAGPVVLKPMRLALAATAPGAVLVPPRYEPAAGALLLALRAAGVAHTPERLALLAATWQMRAAERATP